MNYLYKHKTVGDETRRSVLDNIREGVGSLSQPVNKVWDFPRPSQLMFIEIFNTGSNTVFEVNVRETKNIEVIELLSFYIKFSTETPSEKELDLLLTLDIDNTAGLVSTTSNTLAKDVHPIHVPHNFSSVYVYHEFNIPRLIKTFKEGNGVMKHMKIRLTDKLGRPYSFNHIKLYFNVRKINWD